jgi:predicted transcriptional regulator
MEIQSRSQRDRQGTKDSGRGSAATSYQDTEDGISLAEFQESMLENANREDLVTELRDIPGQNRSQLADKLGISAKTAGFHLDHLAELGLVKRFPKPHGRGSICFVRDDAHLWDEPSTRILFVSSSTRRVGTEVARRPGSTNRCLGEVLDLAPATINHHLEALRDDELVEMLRLGRDVEYYATEPMEEWLEEVGTRFPHGD